MDQFNAKGADPAVLEFARTYAAVGNAVESACLLLDIVEKHHAENKAEAFTYCKLAAVEISDEDHATVRLSVCAAAPLARFREKTPGAVALDMLTLATVHALPTQAVRGETYHILPPELVTVGIAAMAGIATANGIARHRWEGDKVPEAVIDECVAAFKQMLVSNVHEATKEIADHGLLEEMATRMVEMDAYAKRYPFTPNA